MESGIETVALAGNPNAGKTTLFNALCGTAEKVGNYGGVTVSIKKGRFFSAHGHPVNIIDLPGSFSLQGGSPDQLIAGEALRGEGGKEQPDLVVCVLDSSNLERHLLLALEVLELGLPTVIALNMVDVAEKSGLRLDPLKLSEELGVPVVPMQANRGRGIIELKQAIRPPLPTPEAPRWILGDEESRRAFAFATSDLVARRPSRHNTNLSDRLDAILLHPVWGWFSFLAIMFVLFWSIFSFAEIPMGWIESGQDWLSSAVEDLMPPGDLRSLVTKGIIGGVGAVVVFLPQISLLFFFIGLMESSGYMARAAFLMDGFMAKAGLSGKSFLPLLSSYACAIPGIMATRVIDSPKERLVTIFVAPWMSCSARLPVYLLLVPMLMGGREGGIAQAIVFMAIYAVGTCTAFVVARILRGRLGPDKIKNHFLLELPPYRLPQWKYIFRHVVDRSWAFLRKAGTVILSIMILLWAATTYPKLDTTDPGEAIDYSFAGRAGRFIEPVVKPMGFDGRTGTAILTSFAAREVFVGSMAQLYHVDPSDAEGEAGEQATRTGIRQRLALEEWSDGSPKFGTSAVVSLLIFYIYALQCLPTSAVVARETGSMKWTVAQFFFMSIFAAIASTIVYQTLRMIGLS